MVAQEDPKLFSSQSHIESPTVYTGISPEELRAE